MVQFGMVGLGAIAPFYAAAIAHMQGAQLVAVCDIKPERLANYRASGVAEFTSYADFLASVSVDAIVVNVPNDRHFCFAKEALLAGKHVCCEKPLCLELEEAKALYELAIQKRRTLFTAFHRRYNLNFLELERQLPAPAKIASVLANYLERIQDHTGPDSWYLDPLHCGGGCISDNGPNIFDALRFLLGHMDVQDCQITRANGVDMQAKVHLLTAQGIRVTVCLDWQYGHGEKKDVTIQLIDGGTLHADFLRSFTKFKQSLWHEYQGVMRDFVEHIVSGRSDAEAGCDAVRIVEEAYAKEVVS